jgi:FecR protein
MSNETHAHQEPPPSFEPLTRLAREAFGHMTPAQRGRGEVALLERIASVRSRRPAWLIPSLALAGSVLLGGLLWKQSRSIVSVVPRTLSYTVENGSLSEGRSRNAQEKRVVRFSDGTEVRVDDDTQANVRFVTDHGAALAMSRGTLHADVVHAPNAEWRFDAGPFVVRVTGTAFGLSWDPDQDRFDLRLEHGSVTVTSPVANEPIPLRAGQWLTIRMRSNEVFIRDLTGHTPAEPSAEPALAVSATESDVPVVRPDTAAKPPATPRRTWAADLAQGKAQQVVDDALRHGLDGSLAEANSGELAALADAARYLRREEIARKAMLAERRRFPGSRGAVDAGLLLGRLAEAEHEDSQALSWFDTYLAEAPAGRYASEALGRKMALVRRSVGANAARLIALQYLEKYPDGTYAPAARAISNRP